MARYIEEDEQGNRYIVDDGDSPSPTPTPRPAPTPADRPQYTPKPFGELGANQNTGFMGNSIKALLDIPHALYDTGKQVVDFANPYSDEFGQLPDARTSAMLMGGISGAGSGALTGAQVGGAALSPVFPPFGSLVGGGVGALVGGGIGFGTGLTATGAGADLLQGVSEKIKGGDNGITDYVRPLNEYLNDATYNSVQATGIGALTGGLGAVSRVGGLRKVLGDERATNVKVDKHLENLRPGYKNAIDEFYAKDIPLSEHVSLGEILNDPAIKSEQRTLSRGGSEAFRKQQEATNARNDAQLKFLGETTPASEYSAGSVQDIITQGLRDETAAATAKVTDAVDSLPASIDLEVGGTTARDAIKKGLESKRGEVSAAFNKQGEGAVPREPIGIAAEQVFPEYFRSAGATPDPLLTRLREQLTKPGEPILGNDGKPLTDNYGTPLVKEPPFNMKDLQAASSTAIKIIKTGDKRSAAIAHEMLRAMDDAVDQAVANKTVTPEEAAARNLGKALRREQGDIFESRGTPAVEILKENYSGTHPVVDSSVLKQVFKPGPGGREAVANYKVSTKMDPKAIDVLERYAVDSFRAQALTKEGTIITRNADRWIKDHSEALIGLPEVKALLENPRQAQAFLDSKYGRDAVTEAGVEIGALTLWTKGLDPKATVSKLINSPKAAREMKSTVDFLKGKDANAVPGLRRAVVETLIEEGYVPATTNTLGEAILPGGAPFEGRVNAQSMLNLYYDKIKPAVKDSGLFTESQLKNLDTFYDNKASQISVERATMPGGSDTFQNSSVFKALLEIPKNRFLNRNMATRAVGIVLESIIKTIPEAQFLDRLLEVNLNPRLARDLAAKPTARNIERTGMAIFKDYVKSSVGAGVKAGAGTIAQAAPLVSDSAPNQKIVPKPTPKPLLKQESVTAKKSFPTPKELLRPPTDGKLNNVRFDLKEYLSTQSPETQARISVESTDPKTGRPNPYAVSPVGAEGLSQLMPATAMEIAHDLGETYMPLRPGMTPEQQAASIDQNVRFGKHYYEFLLQRYDGDPILARSAYNGGLGNIDKAIKAAGGKSDPRRVLKFLPVGMQKETGSYSDKIADQIAQRYGNV